MTRPVFLDNTVLSHFALISRPDLVLDLWPTARTTAAGMAEYQAGVTSQDLPAEAWRALPVVTLTPEEQAIASGFAERLGAGERTGIAAARAQQGLFASDDLDARTQARQDGVPVTGTMGILSLNVRHGRLSLEVGNELLTQLITLGYRAPVAQLDDYV